ncbi:MAG TPA: ABC transporter ATP-binding protein [Thermomicrobiales bacterium]|nr:ABC transporter ATP-binding protein [Thermomicrobiales bacterium]
MQEGNSVADADGARPGDREGASRVSPPSAVCRLPSADSRPPLVEARRLRFGYGARPVLRDLSLRVAHGEFVGLIGPNGAGKSTLLRLVCGALRPAAGELDFDGAPLARLSRRALARRIAVLPQSPMLPDAFTVAELVLLGRTPHLGLLQPEGRADFAAARRALLAAGCLDLAGRRLGELSGGERQRAALARALAQEPELLLLDEPTAHLDPGHQQELLATLGRLNREAGLTVLAVFHDLNLAAARCDRLALLHDGRAIADGPPAAVLTPPLLRRAYGFEAQVIPHPRTGLPVVIS